MIAEKTVNGSRIVFSTKTEKLCPDCGGPMSEVERINESGFSFIWYKCSRIECGGGWLEKRCAAMRDY